MSVVARAFRRFAALREALTGACALRNQIAPQHFAAA
jgi:hypothetical protein